VCKISSSCSSAVGAGTPVNITTGAEDRNYFGSTDFIVSAALLDDQNNEIECAYIWELKAPQAYLFEFDDNGNSVGRRMNSSRRRISSCTM